MTPPDEPVDLTPAGFVPAPVVVCSTLEQVATLVDVHDGATPSELVLEGTNFRVRLGQHRPLETVFSEKEVARSSEVERKEITKRNARKWFLEARTFAGTALREVHKAQAREARRRKKPPVVPPKVAPLWEETLLRRQLSEAQGVTAATRRELEAVRLELDAAHRRLVELDEGGFVEQVKELEERAELLEEERDGLLRDVAELEGELETMRNTDDQRVAGMDLVDSPADQLVVDYFRDNFRSIPLAALEWIVSQERAG